MFNKQIVAVQGSPVVMNVYAAALCYIALIFGIYYFIIREKKFEHNFRLINQIEGSSGSIMDNIAEGFERGTRNEFIVFLGYSKGSCGELRSQLYRALDRKYIEQQ